MALLLVMALFGVVFAFIGKYLYGVLIGAAQAWNEKVVPAAKQAGVRVGPGQHGFQQLISDRPDGAATAFVNNGVASEESVAEYLRSYNTNAWLTVVTKPYVGGSGPSFKASAQGALPDFWSEKAKELMTRSGKRFEVVSGGQRITIVTTGVVDAPNEVIDMLELAHDLAVTR
jgi:predicted PurR-regulated permease PerM